MNLPRFISSILVDIHFPEPFLKESKSIYGVGSGTLPLCRRDLAKPSANAIELLWLSKGRTLVIRIGRTLDLMAHKEFRSAYEAASDDVHTYVVDFLKTIEIDSSALNMLLLLRDHVNSDRVRLYLMNIGPSVRETLDAAGFSEYFTMGAVVVDRQYDSDSGTL